MKRASTLVSLSLVLFACRSTPQRHAPQPPDPDLAPRSAAALASTAPALPEDPRAGERSTRQWREHLDHEEEERQAIFDRQRLNEHHALVKQLQATRARFDVAGDDNAVKRVQADMPRVVAELERRIHQLDPWGNSSRLLPDYAELSHVLSTEYADAKLAALHGDKNRLEKRRESFDAIIERVDEWLEEAAESEEE